MLSNKGCLLFIMPSHLHLATDAFSVLKCIFFTCHTMSTLQPCSLEAGMPFGILDPSLTNALYRSGPGCKARRRACQEKVDAEQKGMPS